MSSSNQVLPYAPAPVGQSLGQKTSRGFIWLMGQTIALKLLSALGQVVIAYLLVPGELGLVGLAYTTAGFAGVVQQTGVRDILIARHARFRRWANAGFWIALSSGIIACAMQLVMGLFIAHLYPKLIPADTSRIAGLLVLLGLAAPLNALSIVPMAQLSNQLRFRTVAAVNIWQTVSILLLSIFFAAPPFRLGAYAIILPRPIVSLIQAIWLWWITRPPVQWWPQFRRWKFLLGDSGWNVLNWLFAYIIFQGDYFALGMMHTVDVVGIYYFAYGLSMQTQMVFTINLWGVLLPALAKLQDDLPRQTAAFLRAARLLAIVAVPICLLQAAAADPLLHLFFKPKWYSGIPVLQVLSIGMAVQCVSGTFSTLLMARGRFRSNMILQGAGAVVFAALVWNGSMAGGDAGPHRADLTVAVAVACYYAICGPIFLYVAIRPGGGRWQDVVAVLLPPLIAGAAAAAIAMLAASMLPPMPLRDGARVAVTVAVQGAIYLPLIRLLAPKGCADLQARLVDLFAGLRAKFASPA